MFLLEQIIITSTGTLQEANLIQLVFIAIITFLGFISSYYSIAKTKLLRYSLIAYPVIIILYTFIFFILLKCLETLL